jgi:zinc protease
MTVKRLLPLGVALLVLLLPSDTRADDGEPRKRDGVWAQTFGRPADPAVRFGQLPNGMRYAIRRNTTPAGHTSLRLRIGAGSLDEREDQRGLAHFLEHMAFRGSAHVPAGDMVRILQRLGLSFGADTNAQTTFDQTVYRFDLPQSDPGSLGTGLMLLRELAGELTLAQSEMDPERGVVLSEERVRDGPSNRQMIAAWEFLFEGQPAARRMPIGLTHIIRDAPVSLIREFYETYYRPDNATLVAVGDFDVAAMEADILTRFGAWSATPTTRPERVIGEVMPRGAMVRLRTVPSTPAALSISFVGPLDTTADSTARERRDLAETLMVSVLNHRLDQFAQNADAPFLSAFARRSNVMKSAKVTELRIQPKHDGWEVALRAAIATQRQLQGFGPRPDEWEHVTSKTLTTLRNAVARAATRPSPEVAQAIVRTVNDNDVYTSPAQDLAEAESMIASFDAGEVAAATKRLFSGSGPLVFLSDPAEIPGGVEPVREVLAVALSQTTTPTREETRTEWPYAPAATPGQVAERAYIADLNVTEIRFANGVRLSVKPTQYADDEIRVRVRIGYGGLGIVGERAREVWQVSGVAPLLLFSGTEELTYRNIQRLTAGNRLSLKQGLDDDAFVLDGVARAADLARQMQYLQAVILRPGPGVQAFERLRGAFANQLSQIDGTAVGVFRRSFGPALHGGDPRWRGIPDAASIAAAKPDDLAILLGQDFASGPMEITIVGGVTPDQAIDVVAHGFGALPPRLARRPLGREANTVRFPPPGTPPLIVSHSGRADQAIALAAWPTEDFFAGPRMQLVLGTVAAILKTRLTERLRSAEGVTYTPNAGVDASETFRGMGYLFAMVETPVTRVDTFYAALAEIIEALRAAPPTDDDLERARRPRVDRKIKDQQQNEYWLIALAAAQRDPRYYDVIRTWVSGTETVSAADVREAARRFLNANEEFHMIVRPAEK